MDEIKVLRRLNKIPEEVKKQLWYDRYRWPRVHDMMTAKELSTLEKRLCDRKNGVRFDKNAEGKSIIDVGEEFGINNITVIAGGGYAIRPSNACIELRWTTRRTSIM